ncbi:D-alanyl-D-alanine carboxypeptidase [uncultured Maribacter sp.]|uniref:D-alanyl-D-alanine carboxypeptidase n=1 Tax=uncultured Maribacter sp. TaxID=431308 RepID=UPI0026108104|nr:D-alanyl-D-alanine carboxypeptidase [uncultured Maribacter sp.]
MKKNIIYISLIILFFSCKGAKTNQILTTKALGNANFYNNQFTGLLVIDPVTKDTLYNYNGSKYFTPASNTKIYTLYSALKVLPKNIPALTYIVQHDTLYAQGTGDPTLLHPYFKDRTSIHFLKKHKNIVFNFSNYKDSKYGPGWAWEDYDAYFSPERNAFPMYGNVLSIHRKNSLITNPSYFKDRVFYSNSNSSREPHNNIFYHKTVQKDTIEIPFITSATTSKKLLENILAQKINVTSKLPDGPKSTLYGIATDSVCKRMMHVSDNFLAEQLLIMSSGVLKDSLNFKSTKNYILDTYLNDLKQQPRWVDASGLSRYNLFTPKSIVRVLSKLYEEVPAKRLFTLFPKVIHSDSNKNKIEKPPYIYAKSGSLGNNYCLSGYLQTRSGKILIFSFMNNHFRVPSKEVKKQIHKILAEIRGAY